MNAQRPDFPSPSADFSPAPPALSAHDLYGQDGLIALDGRFLAWLEAASPELKAELTAARAALAADSKALDRARESALILALAPYWEDFLGDLFAIAGPLRAAQAAHHAQAPLHAAKRAFVQRRAARAFPEAEARSFDGPALARALAPLLAVAAATFPLPETAFALSVLAWLEDEAAAPQRQPAPPIKAALDLALRYAAWALYAPAGRAAHDGGVLFQVPDRRDAGHPLHAVPAVENGIEVWRLDGGRLRLRDGFGLTDPGPDLPHALDQAAYCITCHHQGKDSCAQGLKAKDGGFARNAAGAVLHGCPLEEKISEMNEAKAQGLVLAALAIAVIDNPMVAGTGHRICNDCALACIYQKQEPVHIPEIETRVLKDVLALPWGFEIYSLLTRYNALNLRRPYPRPDSGYSVLVVGMGPSGYTLAHHLMQDGHRVVAVDGLKIEPLNPDLSGVTPDSERVPFQLIENAAGLVRPLAERPTQGFGGVAEYGITVRWDKNNLTLIRLLLERRPAFTLIGGVRFGGALDIEGAFAAGFDHIALCLGAGKPMVIPVENGLARGVRQASDFLMALQLSGAAKADSLANLQLRLPVVVVGGGLTAVDTATEALAYYVVQVEKFLARFEALGEAAEALRQSWSEEEALIAAEFLAHAQALRAERRQAAKEGRAPDLIRLLRRWGGATIAYRRDLAAAPSVVLNPEEVDKALEEGVVFAPHLAPLAVEIDRFGHAAALRCEVVGAGRDGAGAGREAVLPARAVLVAAGTQPNTVLAREFPDVLALDGRHFQAFDTAGARVRPEPSPKTADPAFLVHRHADGRGVSHFGDLHPSFAGNVVKAMASAKRGAPVIGRILAERPPVHPDGRELAAAMNRDLRARVFGLRRLAPAIIEVVIQAPAAARAFQPGQFYRLQNFEALAPRRRGTLLAMEGLALTGAWVDRERGLVGLIVLEMAGSSALVARLRPGEPVVLMGPTGTPTEIPSGETVLLVGGGLGNAVLFSIGQALRRAGSKVLYVAGYKAVADRYEVAQIEAAADVILWACDEAPGFTPGRAQDRAFVGNVVAAIEAYGRGGLGEVPIALGAVDRIIAIGSDGMMAAVAKARQDRLADLFRPGHVAIGSINSPMQCMMKEICAQCLQPQTDPVTGETRVVFSCANQDQPLDAVDFGALRQRLSQNGTQEKLTGRWIAHCLRGSPPL